LEYRIVPADPHETDTAPGPPRVSCASTLIASGVPPAIETFLIRPSTVNAT